MRNYRAARHHGSAQVHSLTAVKMRASPIPLLAEASPTWAGVAERNRVKRASISEKMKHIGGAFLLRSILPIAETWIVNLSALRLTKIQIQRFYGACKLPSYSSLV